jgi:hypothetical protein
MATSLEEEAGRLRLPRDEDDIRPKQTYARPGASQNGCGCRRVNHVTAVLGFRTRTRRTGIRSTGIVQPVGGQAWIASFDCERYHHSAVWHTAQMQLSPKHTAKQPRKHGSAKGDHTQ